MDAIKWLNQSENRDRPCHVGGGWIPMDAGGVTIATTVAPVRFSENQYQRKESCRSGRK